MLTANDESYTHQLVAPAAVTAHRDPAWAERCYHLLHVGGATILHAGRALYAHGHRRTGFAGATTGEVQHAVRYEEPFAAGDDPDRPTVGGLRIETVRPLEEVRLVLDEPGFPLAFELTYTARFPPVATDPNRIELEGRVVTEYMNLFQSGRYDGTVVIDGAEHRVDARAGFRDRGWGLRKHEGAPRRGFVLAGLFELDEHGLYVMLYETASGRRVFTNGWLIGATVDPVAGATHELAWDGALLTGGRVELTLASGRALTAEFEVQGRLFLAPAGYRPEHQGAGVERHDVTRPDVVAALEGQTDNAIAVTVDGLGTGHGYVETGLGVHARYRPHAASA
jgi:hypothetical protein